VEIVSWFSRLGVVSGLNVDSLKAITLEHLSDRQDLIYDVTKLIKKLDLSIDNLDLESRNDFLRQSPARFTGCCQKYHQSL